MMRKSVLMLLALAISTIGFASACNSLEAQAAVRAALAQRAAIHNDPFLVCVRNHESATSGLYSAENPISTASGAYQFVDGTWNSVKAQAGYGWHPARHASYAEPHVQDAVAYWASTHGQRTHWSGTGCPGT